MDWIATILTLFCIWLNARKIRACWIFGVASNILWMAYAGTGQIPLLTVNLVMLILNIYGWFKWRSK